MSLCRKIKFKVSTTRVKNNLKQISLTNLCLVTPLLSFNFPADWRFRHAALMAISAVAEGCVKQMEPMLESVIGTILPFLQDPHPRVRHACCNALGQLATDFNIIFQKKFHATVMPGRMQTIVFVTSNFVYLYLDSHT